MTAAPRGSEPGAKYASLTPVPRRSQADPSTLCKVRGTSERAYGAERLRVGHAASRGSAAQTTRPPIAVPLTRPSSAPGKLRPLAIAALCASCLLTAHCTGTSSEWSGFPGTIAGNQRDCVADIVTDLYSATGASVQLSMDRCRCCLQSTGGQCPVASNQFTGEIMWATPGGMWTCDGATSSSPASDTTNYITRTLGNTSLRFCAVAQPRISTPYVAAIVVIPMVTLLGFCGVACWQMCACCRKPARNKDAKEDEDEDKGRAVEHPVVFTAVHLSIPQGKWCLGLGAPKKNEEELVPDRIPERDMHQWSAGDKSLVRNALAKERLVYSAPPLTFGPSPAPLGMVACWLYFLLRGLPVLIFVSLRRLLGYMLCMRWGKPPDEVSNFWADLWFRLKNVHTVISIVAVHPLNPKRPTTRFLNALATALWAFFVNYINGLITEESFNGNVCKNQGPNCDAQALRATTVGVPKSGPGPVFATTILSIALKLPWTAYEDTCLNCWPFCCFDDASYCLQRLRTAGFYLFGIFGLPVAMVLFLLAVCYTQGGPAVAMGNWAITFFGSIFGLDMAIFLINFAKGYRTEMEWRSTKPDDPETPAKPGCLPCGKAPATSPTTQPEVQVMLHMVRHAGGPRVRVRVCAPICLIDTREQEEHEAEGVHPQPQWTPPAAVVVVAAAEDVPASSLATVAEKVTTLEQQLADLSAQADAALRDCSALKAALQMEEKKKQQHAAPPAAADHQAPAYAMESAGPKKIPALRLD